MQPQKKYPQFRIYHNNDKCFLVLVIYIIYVFFNQKAENNRFLKKPVGQNIVILFSLK